MVPGVNYFGTGYQADNAFLIKCHFVAKNVHFPDTAIYRTRNTYNFSLMTHDLAVLELPTQSHTTIAVECPFGARAGRVPTSPTRPPGVAPNCTCGAGLPCGRYSPWEGHLAHQGRETRHGSHEVTHDTRSWKQSAPQFVEGRGWLRQKLGRGGKEDMPWRRAWVLKGQVTSSHSSSLNPHRDARWTPVPVHRRGNGEV